MYGLCDTGFDTVLMVVDKSVLEVYIAAVN